MQPCGIGTELGHIISVQKKGLEATGILANVCKNAGITSVADLLVKNPKAKRVDVPILPPKPKVCIAKIKSKDSCDGQMLYNELAHASCLH